MQSSMLLQQALLTLMIIDSTKKESEMEFSPKDVSIVNDSFKHMCVRMNVILPMAAIMWFPPMAT